MICRQPPPITPRGHGNHARSRASPSSDQYVPHTFLNWLVDINKIPANHVFSLIQEALRGLYKCPVDDAVRVEFGSLQGQAVGPSLANVVDVLAKTSVFAPRVLDARRQRT